MKKLLAMMMAFALLSGCATGVERAEKRALKAAQVATSLASRHYKVDVRMMYPLRGKASHVNGSYSLEVKGDTLMSYLPYFGRAYSLPYGGGKGLNFTETIGRYESATDEKGRTQVAIVVNNGEDVFTYMLEVYDNGSATIDVYARERESIRFSGELVTD